MVSKKASIVSDRRQSIVGAERVIEDENGRVKRGPGRPRKVQSVGVNGDPDGNQADYKLVNIQNPHLGVMPIRNEGERYYRSLQEQEAGVALKTEFHPGSLETTDIDIDLPVPEITVEPGPPIPAKGGYNTAEFKYPIRLLLKSNDFFFIPGGTSKADQKSITSRCRYLGFKVITRKNFEYKGRVGLGVWRK